jgi:hypothetical protein
MGAPGCPEFASCTASIARVLRVLTHRLSRVDVFTGNAFFIIHLSFHRFQLLRRKYFQAFSSFGYEILLL